MLKKILLIFTLFLMLGIKCTYCQANEAVKNDNVNTELSSLLKEANSYIIKDHTKTIELYEKALKIDPKCAEAYYYIGSMYLWEDKPEKSLPYFQNTLKYDPKYILAYGAIAVNCDILAEYDLTLKYIEQYRKEFPNDKLNNELADKQLKTTEAKRKYSEELVKGIIPKVKMDITAPKWIPGYRTDNAKMGFSQLIVRNKNINTTPEALSFYEFKGIANRFISAKFFALSYVNSLKKRKPTITYNIIKLDSNRAIFETSDNEQYDLFKCVLGKNSVYMINYTLKPNEIYPERKQYWIDTFKKVQFTDLNK